MDGTLTVQYWKSQEHLNAFARERMWIHFPNMLWQAKMSRETPHVGVWHGSFVVRAGEYESIYIYTPWKGLGKAGRAVPAAGSKRTARGRLGITDGTDLAEVDLPPAC
jgi:hypothetical protein